MKKHFSGMIFKLVDLFTYMDLIIFGKFMLFL